MKKSLIALAMAAFISLSATAQAVVAEEGKMLQASDGARIGAIYRVGTDGSAQVIINGKMVSVPASTLSVVDGKLTTSLSKSEVRKLK